MTSGTHHHHGVVHSATVVTPEASLFAVRPSTIANRYSRALFSFIKEAGIDRLREYNHLLSDLSMTVDGSPELSSLLDSPIFSGEEKKAIFHKLLDDITGKTLSSEDDGRTIYNFCNMLIDNERIGLLHEIAVGFTYRLHAEEGIESCELTTAIELVQDKRGAVQSQIEAALKRKINLNFSVDPEILGGVRLRIGDRLVDASLRTQLNILKDTIKQGE
jgi:F-type H+-transporting ATPase subunit delta